MEVRERTVRDRIGSTLGKGDPGCIVCYKCHQNKDRRCAVTEDAANEYIEKMLRGRMELSWVLFRTGLKRRKICWHLNLE